MEPVSTPIANERRKADAARLGWNIETMDDYIPLSSFDAIYLVDLCEPLLQVARKRFARKGWKNVHVVHCDASRFVVPDDKFGRKGKASLVTMSYSLSMVSSALDDSL